MTFAEDAYNRWLVEWDAALFLRDRSKPERLTVTDSAGFFYFGAALTRLGQHVRRSSRSAWQCAQFQDAALLFVALDDLHALAGLP